VSRTCAQVVEAHAGRLGGLKRLVERAPDGHVVEVSASGGREHEIVRCAPVLAFAHRVERDHHVI
jgi:hypothetical protein